MTKLVNIGISNFQTPSVVSSLIHGIFILSNQYVSFGRSKNMCCNQAEPKPEIGSDLLLVSEVVFSFNILCKCLF